MLNAYEVKAGNVGAIIYLYSSKNDSNQTNKKEQKKLDSEHNIENTVTYTPT